MPIPPELQAKFKAEMQLIDTVLSVYCAHHEKWGYPQLRSVDELDVWARNRIEEIYPPPKKRSIVTIDDVKTALKEIGAGAKKKPKNEGKK